MWSKRHPANVDISGANDIAYHWAIMMTTDLNFVVNVVYSATDVFNKLNEGSKMSTRSSVSSKQLI
jgi:hypothetical protein